MCQSIMSTYLYELFMYESYSSNDNNKKVHILLVNDIYLYYVYYMYRGPNRMKNGCV